MENGPFHIFEKLRDKLIPPGEIKGFIPELLTCIYCLSFWTFGVLWLVWQFTEIPIILLAGSACALIYHSVIAREH